VSSKQDVQSLFDEVSATYDSSGVDFFGQIARELVARAQLGEGSIVLDVGCGAGAVLVAASQVVGPTGRLIGIDLAEGMVERARQVVCGLGLANVQVRVGDAEAPPTASRSLDAVVASLVLFFLPNIDAALEAYADALVVGGTLAFSTFGGDDDWTVIDQLLESFTPPPPGETEPWFQRPTGIRSTLEAHGFHSVSIDHVTHQVEFPTLAAFHEWNWSTGARATWRAIPAEDRESARAAVNDYLSSVQEHRGALRLETAVRYTRGTAS
jgi:O-methyltransferase/aklanonic acid methyltransferase